MNNRKWLAALGATALALPLAVSLAFVPAVSAQTYTPDPGQQAPRAAFSQQDLDRMLAPIALYPDSLLSQILMAATYPLEVEQAARWSSANPDLLGDQAVRAVEAEDWDPSVKSLVAFPQILAMMDAKPEWTDTLGDAFLAQESQVMDTVQNLRQRAYAAGNLRSDDQIRVVPQGPAIVVEPAYPEIVYVPYYDPTVIYGTWWWPAPPVYWAPWRGYHAPRPGYHFAWSSGIPVSRGFFFGAIDWPRRHARVVNVNTYYFNRAAGINRHANVHNHTTVRNMNTAPGVWQHNPAHRRGAPYRDAGVRARFVSEGAPMNTRAAPPVAQPQVRASDNSANAVRESRTRVDEHNAEAARRAAIRQETLPNRNDDRRRHDGAARFEHRNEATRHRDAVVHDYRQRPPEMRREAPAAVRAETQAPLPRVERPQSVRPVPQHIPQPRAESAVRHAPVPQPRMEAPRPVQQAAPVQRAPESRPHGSGHHGPRHGGGGEPRRGGRDPQRPG